MKTILLLLLMTSIVLASYPQAVRRLIALRS